MPQQAPNDPNANVPVELVRRYEVLIRPQAKHKPLRLREVSADHIGRLVTLQVCQQHTPGPETCGRPAASVTPLSGLVTGVACTMLQLLALRCRRPFPAVGFVCASCGYHAHARHD